MSQNDTDTLITDLENTKISSINAYPNIKSIVTLFFISILFMIAVALPAGIISIGIPNNAQIIKSLLNLVMYVSSLSLIIRYAVKRSRKQHIGAFKINFNPIQGWLVPAIVIGGFALIIPLSQISDLVPMPGSVRKFFEQAFKKDAFSIATLIIAAPILEEILCRGIVLKGLLLNYSARKAIIISAIFFAAIHLNPWQALPAFFGGLFMGWLYYKTQSVIPGIIAHATINTTATLFMFAPAKQQDLLVLLGEPYYILAVIVSVMIFAATCLVIQKKVLIISKD
jgi:membrane protease YdiL (CAAX protease family)